MKRLIVEGPDGAGKTTLIDQLNVEFPMNLEPRVVDKETNAMVDLKKWVELDVKDDYDTYLGMDFGFRVYDRHRLISEPIYGPILRQTQQPGFDNQIWIFEQLRQFWSLDPTLIYCLPPPAVVHAKLINDPENGAVLNRWESIYTAYLTRAALDKLSRPQQVLIYDYTHPEPAITHIRSALYKRLES